MKKFIFLVAGILMAVMAYAQDLGNYRLNIGQFDKVKIYDNVNVVYRCLPDSSGYVQFQGTEEFENAFIFNLKKDGTLKIQVNTEDIGKPDLPVLYIYSDFLISAENSSDFSLSIENPAPCAEFSATQVGNGSIDVENIKANKVIASITTGSGTVTLSGACVSASFRMVGAGLISADRLKADEVSCRILGTGSIGCWPLEKLQVRGIGTTKIYYKGNPQIKKSGGGKLFELPEESEEEYYAAPIGREVREVIVEEEISDEEVDIDDNDDEGDDDEGDEEDDDDDDDDDVEPTVVTEEDD